MITRPAFTHERSVTDRVWRYRLDNQGEAQALALQQEHGVSDALARILASSPSDRSRLIAMSFRQMAARARRRSPAHGSRFMIAFNG